MNAAEFVRSSVQALHQSLLEDMKDLSPHHLEWRPQPAANPIGYIFLHYIHTEDAQVHNIQGCPSIWEVEKWQERFGLAAGFGLSDSGAGVVGLYRNPPDNTVMLSGEEGIVRAAQIPLAESLAYAQRVIDRTRKFLNTLDDRVLDVVPDPERPRRTIAVTFRAFVLAHGWWHLGEIKYLKGLQGMPGLV